MTEAQVNFPAATAAHYTAQLPPKPTVTLPSSTMTGISRLPSLRSIMRRRPSSSSSTLTYSKGMFLSE